MSAPEEKLTPPQHRALNALLQATNVQAAAELAGLTSRTLRRYLAEPEFRSAYLDARRAAVQQTAASLQAAGSAAVVELQAILSDPQAPASARVRAAHIIIEYGSRGLEQEDFSERLDRLEQELER